MMEGKQQQQEQDENILVLHNVINAAMEAGVIKGSINDKQSVFNALYNVAGYKAKLNLVSAELEKVKLEAQAVDDDNKLKPVK